MMIEKPANKLYSYILLLLSAVSYINITYFVQREEFHFLVCLFIALFLMYIYFLKSAYFSVNQLVSISFIFRIIVLFSFPTLSDDYFRFVWDGLLNNQGINPFLNIPEYYIKNQIEVPGLTETLFLNLNSPKYYSIYPPVCQFIFSTGTIISPIGNLFAPVLVMKIFILLGEIITTFSIFKILKHLRLSKKFAFIYLLNPLVIIELCGNLHFEGLMITFLSLSFLFLIKKRLLISSLFFALAVCTKLLPLMFLPILFKYLGWKKSTSFYLLVGVFIIIFFSPFISIEMISGITSSINLYFQKFEFNASTYYIVRWIGYKFIGYNIIQTAGRVLSLITITFIIVQSIKNNSDFNSINYKMLTSLALYFFMATIVHPWYLTGLVFFSVFSKHRFAIIWSGTVILSYSAYQSESYQENLLLVSLEYLIVFGVLTYEIIRRRPIFTI